MQENCGKIRVVAEETAKLLLHAECKDKIKVSVAATVSCLSEIFRIKQVQIFVVQLIPGLNIVVKMKDFLKWHGQIVPQKCYIFTHLQPTSITRGCQGHHRVYTVSRDSELICIDDQDEADTLTVEEWLQHCGIDEGSVQLPGDDFQPETDSDCKLVSYKGVVTKVLDEALGVFEIDNRVRWYVSAVPAVHKYEFIQVGLSVTLYNVHCKASKQAPRIRLYCCMLSVVKPDNGVEGGATRSCFPDHQLQKLLYQQGVTIPQLDWLYTTREALFQYFKGKCGRRDIERIFSLLISSPKLFSLQECDAQRNFLDEFLTDSHKCCLAAGDESGHSFPSYKTVSQLKHDVETGDIFNTNPSEYWQFERKTCNNDQILVGILDTNSRTGRTRLFDTTSHIDTVIAGCHSEAHLSYRHRSCCCDERQHADSFSCPYVQSCCIGKIVAIYKYSVAMETFVVGGNQLPPVVDSLAKRHKVLYVEFSLSDAVILGNTIARNKSAVLENELKKTGALNKLQTINADTVKSLPEKESSGSRMSASRTRNKGTDKFSDLEDRNKYDNIVETPVCSKEIPAGNKGEIKEVQQMEVNPDSEHTASKSVLHRHTSEGRGSYFCRKETCLQQSQVEHNSQVLHVKPIFQKRKSPSDDKMKCKALCVEKAQLAEKSQSVSSSDRSLIEKQKHVKNKENKTSHDYEAAGTAEYGMETEIPNLKSQKDTKDYAKPKGEYYIAHKENSCIIRVNSRESLILEAQAKDSISLMFSIQGQQWKNGIFEPEIVIICKGKAVRWYPILCPDNLYCFSVEENFTPVLKGGLANSKVQKAVERSKAKRCFVAHEEVMIDGVSDDVRNSEAVSLQLTTISVVIQGSPGVSDKFISFQGQIIKRSHSEPEPMKGRLQRTVQQISAFTDWSKFQISTPENRCIRLQVRDMECAAEIMVFMNLENMMYPLGLFPGAVVLFTKLERKVSKMGNTYCRFVALSSVHVLTLPCTEGKFRSRAETVAEAETDQETEKPKQRLVDLWQSRTAATEFQCVCDVLQIIKVSLKSVCDLCGSTVVESECPSSGCHMENGTKFMARISFIVDDGTSVAMVTQTGSEVRRMLGLSHDQWVCLEEEVREHGEVFVQQTRPVYGTALEKFVYMLCDNRQVKKTWQMTLKTKYNKFSRTALDLDTLSLDDFALKSVDTGTTTVNTRCLPFLQLDCTGLQEVDPTVWALHYLSSS